MSSTPRGQNLTYSIAHNLGVAVVTGVYSTNNPLPIESELCRQYNASRTVERESNWNLLDPDVLGWLLERKFSPALLIEFTEIRLAIEPAAATLAARSA